MFGVPALDVDRVRLSIIAIVLALLSSLIPLLVLFRLVSIALFAAPETDDFCFAYHYLTQGMAETIWHFYSTVIGGIVPIVLIATPAMISNASGIDLFILYPLILIAFALAFVAIVIWVVCRLWPGAFALQKLFIGLAMAAIILSGPISLREMLYWAPGVFCYTVPAAIVMIILVELFRSAAIDEALSPRMTATLGLLCFLAAMCNEFTPIWLLGIIASSFLFRVTLQRLHHQSWSHAILFGATLISFLIPLAAPGNSIRMTAYPAGGRIIESIENAFPFLQEEMQLLLGHLYIQSWIGAAALSGNEAPAFRPS